MGIALITDYDLDGCGSTIFAKKNWNFAETFAQGYKKTTHNLEKVSTDNASIICADICMTPEEILYIREKHKWVMYFDHHLNSIPYLDEATKHFNPIVDLKRCSTMIMYDYVVSAGYMPSEEETMLAKLINVYDLWKTDDPLWDVAYNLNIIFWMYGFWDFEKRFENGFDGFNVEEDKHLAVFWAESNDAMAKCAIEDLSNDAIIIGLHEARFMTEATFYFDTYKLFFIVYADKDGDLKLSIRARDDSIDVNEVLSTFNDHHHLVKSAGGHKQACGVTWKDPSIQLDEIMDFIKNELWERF